MVNTKIIYSESSLLEYIFREVDKVAHIITDTARAETLILERIARYIKEDKRRLKHKRILRRLVHQTISTVISEYKIETYVTFTDMENEGDEGDLMIYEPKDVLADVESEIIAKEMTALLAQDDHRKKVILGNWVNGNDNTSDIARLLAQTIGGNVEAHRKYIRRFQLECRDKLATAI